MKDRVRESVFNLVGPAIVGSHAIDLFAGTGALALEAISRGAKRATALEKHFDMAELVEENARSLGIENLVTVIAGDTFVWAATKPELGHDPWVIFCSPPYDLYRSRPGDIVRLLDGLIQRAPAGSVIVVESDQGFDTGRLPQRDAWTVRDYPPARLAILHVG
jgi:16S rRNA (guanine966-N2)-methyltransferase